jgi:hypothetical protein
MRRKPTPKPQSNTQLRSTQASVPVGHHTNAAATAAATAATTAAAQITITTTITTASPHDFIFVSAA